VIQNINTYVDTTARGMLILPLGSLRGSLRPLFHHRAGVRPALIDCHNPQGPR
jgi:hypothetical protein